MTASDVVVVGVDASPGARSAVAWAADEAERRGCRLRAITAWSLPTPRPTGPSSPPAGLTDPVTAREQAQTLVEDVTRSVLGEVTVSCEAVRGRPVPVLLDAAGDARLLVVGAGGGRRLRSGSVAEQVTRRAPCPVLVVPGGAGT